MHCSVCVLLLCPRDISKLYHVSSGCMANIALSPRGATHPRASVQYLLYIPPSRDITITYILDLQLFDRFFPQVVHYFQFQETLRANNDNDFG